MTTNTPTMAREMEHAHHYHQWVFSAFKHLLVPGGITLEIGGGHGEYTKLLAGLSSRVIVTDSDSKALEKMKEKLSGLSHVEVLQMEGMDPCWRYGLVDNIVVINLLEHIEDDQAFIRACVPALREGGRVIIFSPAFQFLYSEMDRQAGHYRRYSRFELNKMLEAAGLQEIHSRYFNFLGFWGWLFNKSIRTGVDSRFSNFQVRLFNNMIIVSKILEVFTCFCGQSALVVGERRREARA